MHVLVVKKRNIDPAKRILNKIRIGLINEGRTHTRLTNQDILTRLDAGDGAAQSRVRCQCRPFNVEHDNMGPSNTAQTREPDEH